MSATAFQRMRREAALRAASVDLEDMEVEQLIAYAEKAGISLGKSTSKEGILKKIKDARDAVSGGTADDTGKPSEDGIQNNGEGSEDEKPDKEKTDSDAPAEDAPDDKPEE